MKIVIAAVAALIITIAAVPSFAGGSGEACASVQAGGGAHPPGTGQQIKSC